MTREEYGNAYQKGFNLTIRFLMSRGVSYDTARETAQAAWAKGWERLGQLRDHSVVIGWMNTIALNLHRSDLRREPQRQELPEISTKPKVNWAALDIQYMFKACRQNDCALLQRHYLEGYSVQEIAKQKGWTETGVRTRLFRARYRAARNLEARARVPGA